MLLDLHSDSRLFFPRAKPQGVMFIENSMKWTIVNGAKTASNTLRIKQILI